MSTTPSQHTLDASLEAKMKIVAQREQQTHYLEERRNRKEILENYLKNSNLSEKDKSELRDELNEKESEYMRFMRAKLSPKDFETIKVIGRGGFGEVKLVVRKGSNEVYAMKLMKKKDMIERKQIEHVRAERDILAQTHFTNDWVVKMYYSFQDEEYLYIVMEYLGGGDMMSLLIKEDIFTEEMARFYIAELFLAIDSIHKLSYIHRDIKPDNILIGYDGHIKLTDFGLCTGFHRIDTSITLKSLIEKAQKEQIKVDLGITTMKQMHDYKHRSRDLVYSVVGTPDYTAPEVFERVGYGKECDYWSIGCILFEMVCGFPPFLSDDAVQTCLKIVNYPESYKFPSRLDLSDEVKDLIHHLICPVNKRYSSIEEVKAHPFFKGFDFNCIEKNIPPYLPKLSSMFDTSNFEDFEEEENFDTKISPQDTKNLAFVGYTYKGFLNVCNPNKKKNSHSGVTLEQIFTSHENNKTN
ncbi:serine/threonine protein kinase, putative [Entamoeba dispar SAW760]|uniref:non-specific serine/threonine protein kinase n=1 Tax=Entamoeba dispar (strain ATCC PRA-260 / SAW760) TaxID=370354 RepID=B0EAW9_ENTDS|nr:serine/threonine protein kinase, putative [Entamoeba dispar SAW760]EDR28337.1 serine/threonine protein kinase, putative [Entamoeba dispar SAW760]|eukprot:EDR28337.1 serine/threonine protein kinase, putative [Entamoeba dispar SAW760]